MIVCITWEDVFTVTLKVTNMHDKLQTLVNRISHPLRYHILNPDLENIVFSLTALGPALDMNSTFATVFGPTGENDVLYIGYRL